MTAVLSVEYEPILLQHTASDLALDGSETGCTALTGTTCSGRFSRGS